MRSATHAAKWITHTHIQMDVWTCSEPATLTPASLFRTNNVTHIQMDVWTGSEPTTLTPASLFRTNNGGYRGADTRDTSSDTFSTLAFLQANGGLRTHTPGNTSSMENHTMERRLWFFARAEIGASPLGNIIELTDLVAGISQLPRPDGNDDTPLSIHMRCGGVQTVRRSAEGWGWDEVRCGAARCGAVRCGAVRPRMSET
jgi:hypothetical protein